VTAFELLAAVDAAPREKFPDVKQRIELAYHLCRGRILEDPRHLICKELLRIPAPQLTLPTFAPVLRRHMDVIRRAKSFDQLTRDGVSYKWRKAKLNDTTILTKVMADPKLEWMKTVENMADERCPEWRENFRATGKRLPVELAEGLRSRSSWLAMRPTYVKALLAWLGAVKNEQALVDEIGVRLDAALEFVTFVTREFLLSNYNLEKHQSDVFDHFQLLHLALDRFVIVTADPDLLTRTQKSAQASRIMTFDQFLGATRWRMVED
jgi:hypothetical protein